MIRPWSGPYTPADRRSLHPRCLSVHRVYGLHVIWALLL